MRSTVALAAIAIGLLAACDSPPAQSPPEDNLVNATATDQAFPSQATANDIITGDDATHGGAAKDAGAGQQGQQEPPPQ